MKGINLRIVELKENLVRDINEAGLPPIITQMVLNEMLQPISALAAQQIAEERAAEEGENNHGKEICKD